MAGILPLIWPKPLPAGGTIGVFAPSWAPEADRLAAGVKRLSAMGYRLVLHPQTHLQIETPAGLMGGEPAVRAAAFRDLVDDPAIDAILGARGGYGCGQWVGLLGTADWAAVRGAAKPVAGFSDVTVLLNAQAVSAGLIGWHAPLLSTLATLDPQLLASQPDLSPRLDAASDQAWPLALSGQTPALQWDAAPSDPLLSHPLQGRLVGGNLCLLQQMIATPQDPLASFGDDPLVLALEDFDEDPYRLDRSLRHLHASGRLQRVVAVILGSMIDRQGHDWASVAQRVLQQLLPDLPIVMGAPFGHGLANHPLPIGAWVTLNSQTANNPRVQWQLYWQQGYTDGK
ncbi:MAG: LD-carboxypeptidase [Holosporaceae bacterium]|nr:LD-carboxypeptidase [Rhodospirillaceae bacterium]